MHCGKIHLLDNLVSAGEQRARNGYPERARRFEVDNQLERSGPLNGKVGRLLALENSAGIEPDQAVALGAASGVADQATCDGKLPVLKHRRDRPFERQCGEPRALLDEECIGADDESLRPQRHHGDCPD